MWAVPQQLKDTIFLHPLWFKGNVVVYRNPSKCMFIGETLLTL